MLLRAVRPLRRLADTCRSSAFRSSSALRLAWCLSSGRRGFAPVFLRNFSSIPTDYNNGQDTQPAPTDTEAVLTLSACPGCGALAQTVAPGEAGYFDLNRGAIKRYLKQLTRRHSAAEKSAQDAVFSEAAATAADTSLRQELDALKKSIDVASQVASKDATAPLCDRCHDLLHHHTGVPIFHPSMDSIQDTIAESPYKSNHIYHVLDAADFPLSLVPRIAQLLSTSPLRSRNRRAKNANFKHGKKHELSFIITRSDLLAPKKEQIDHLMPYLVEVLRDALGRSGKDVRLGNVRCVSAKRGWWTRDLKADIWRRGGASWMVGKVNVGKSNLFEVVFPKGKAENINLGQERGRLTLAPSPEIQYGSEYERVPEIQDEDSLLPPARLETPFPIMPTVSSLPGTTASPIRIPFGDGRGELIDLPGLTRSSLEDFVPQERRDEMVMKSRVAPEQYILKPGQSLLIGGLVKISPLDKSVSILAYPFVPIPVVVRSDRKMAEAEASDRVPGSLPHSIVKEQVTRELSSAGRFQLEWDVTKQRAGPLTRSDAAGLKPKELPFRVFSADILIESVGWVELAVQVRRKDYPEAAEGASVQYPAVEVFSPQGKFIGVRRPMGAWSLGKPLRETPGRRRTVFSKLKRKA